jgi:RNA-directed DNA polymerase
MLDSSLVSALARSFLAGELSVEEVVARSSHALGRPWPWLHPLAQRYVKTFTGHVRPRQRDTVEFLVHDRGFQRAWSKHKHQLAVAHWLTEPQQMQPVAAAELWNVPELESSGALANWLGLETGELRWFADLKGLGYKRDFSRLRHYHYRVLTKAYGNIRLIEAPKPRRKEIQKQILSQILERVPPHDAVHGFVKGQSIKTFVAPHAGKRVILHMDLQDFFPSFRAARTQALFRTLGYPESVADLLAGICTNAVPRDVWTRLTSEVDPQRLREAQILYAKPHLPQGAPTSPALANLCTYRVDLRLSGLARSAGAEYTRYADDLAFSGDEAFERHVERFSTHVAAVLMEEGFTVHFRKTRVMRQGVRQHLAGIVANKHPNVVRRDFDQLKATLTNCLRHGPKSQNREAHPRFREHLEGRVSFVEMINPAKGKRVRTLFERIQWH